MTRKMLIAAQAAAITFLAVFGAYGTTAHEHKCPVTVPAGVTTCP